MEQTSTLRLEGDKRKRLHDRIGYVDWCSIKSEERFSVVNDVAATDRYP